MLYPLPTSFNSWLLIAIGLAFVIGGFVHVVMFRGRLFSIGLVATGVGLTILGLTEGFADPTPRGKLLYRIAIISFVVGVPIVAYGAYQLATRNW